MGQHRAERRLRRRRGARRRHRRRPRRPDRVPRRARVVTRGRGARRWCSSPASAAATRAAPATGRCRCRVGESTECRSIATTRSSSGCTSSARPTASSPCSPAGTAGCARSARACGARTRASAPGSSRAATSTCSCTRGCPRGRPSPGGRRGLDVVQQTESLGAFGAQLAGDYARWTSASAICETAERLTEEGEPALRLYLLVVGALRALAAREHDAGLILDAFLIRAMANAGWEPALRECAKCSRPGPHAAFNVAAGGVVCELCRPGGSVRPQPATDRADGRAARRRLDRGRRQRSDGPPRGQRAGRRAPAVAPRARSALAAARRPGLTRRGPK